MIVDATMLNDKKACDMLALIRHVFGLRLPNDAGEALQAGSLMHEWRAAWVQHPERGVQTPRPADYPDTVVEPAYAFENVEVAFQQWARSIQTKAQWTWDPSKVELYVERQMNQDITYCALIDTVPTVPAGKAIVEFKTRVNPTEWYLKKWRLHGQLIGQWWVMADKEAIQCQFVDIADIHRPPSNPAKPLPHRRSPCVDARTSGRAASSLRSANRG